MEKLKKTANALDLASLVVELPDGKVLFPLAGRESTVGRDPANVICIPDRFVSSFHARLVCDGDEAIFVEDLGSENRTLVNGEIVTKSRVHYGDEIHFATVSCRLLAPNAAEARALYPTPPPHRTVDPATRTAKLEPTDPVVGTPVGTPGQQRLRGVLIVVVGTLLLAGAIGLLLRTC